MICPADRKARYSTEEIASKVAARAAAERNVALRIYYCGACQGFHLSKKPSLLDQHEGKSVAAKIESLEDAIERGRQICAVRIGDEPDKWQHQREELHAIRERLSAACEAERESTQPRRDRLIAWTDDLDLFRQRDRALKSLIRREQKEQEGRKPDAVKEACRESGRDIGPPS